jgi:Winged helix-turn helix
MPLPVTPHQVTFTPEQLAQARKLAAARAAPLRAVVRAKLTLIVAERPAISHAAAAKQVGLHPDTVYAWRRRWAQEGWSLADAPRSGRPRAFSPAGDDPR